MKRLIKSNSLPTLAFLILLTGSACSQDVENQEHLIGKVQFETSCSDDVGLAFNKAVALLHHMTYPQAMQAFENIAEADPECAMAYWGMGMTLFQPLWPTRPGPDELQEGWELIQKAKSLSPPTHREQLFIATLEAFFQDPDVNDYWARIRRWADVTEKLYQQFPEDPETRAFFALSLLALGQVNSQVMDYSKRAAEIALSIHEENPLHPGATHYLIHANDAPGREHKSLDIVRSYNTMAPRNPHALHMPTHIYTRLGNWQEVIDGNKLAADAALEHPVGIKGEYIWDEYPHALEYLLYAYLQQGADNDAAEQIRLLYSKRNLQPSFKTAFNLASMPARYVLERKAWAEAAALSPQIYEGLDWNAFPWPESVTWFARGMGAIHEGNLGEAQRVLKRLQYLEEEAAKAGEELFKNQIKILRLGVSAWISRLEGNEEQAIELMKMAADLEVSTPKHPVTPAPTLPAYELLGDLLMEQGYLGEALAAFKKTLELYPQRFNSLLGAARAARAMEDRKLANEFYTALLELATPGSSRKGLIEARGYLNSAINIKK